MEKIGLTTLVPLNERNFATWKVQVKMHLMKDDLYNIVLGTESAPVSSDAAALRKYEQRRDKALATIVLAVEPKLLYLLGDPKDPKVVWQKLQDTFQKKTWANKFRLKRKLYNMKLKSGDSLQVHLKSCVELFDELSVIGDPVENEDRVIILLASLPESYSTLVTALETMEKVPSWDSVTEKLIHEAEKIHSVKSPAAKDVQESEKTLFTKQKKSVKCYECNKVGHVKKNCYLYIKKCKERKGMSYSGQGQGVKNKQSLFMKKVDHDDELTLYVSALSTGTNMSRPMCSKSWIIDSGATQHMCNDKILFSSFTCLETPIKVEVGDGGTLLATGEGAISLKVNLVDKVENRILKKVLYVPDLAHNLISVSQVTQGGKEICFLENSCKIISKNKILLAVGKKIGKLYMLDCTEDVFPCSNDGFVEEKAHCSSNVSSDEILWHRRFCHLGMNNLKKLKSKSLVKGLEECKFSIDSIICENCCDGKNHKIPFPVVNSNRKRKIFELIHSDVCGKLNPGSLGGGYYFVTFIDDASRYTWIYILKNKSDVFNTFKNWKSLVENLYEKKIKIFRTDNGGEYSSNEFESYLQEAGIRHEKTIPKTPEQNGVAERMNRTLIEAVRCMLSDSNLPKTFWAEALSTAVYVRNRCPTSSLKDMTPYEALNSHKPNVSHLRTFGCISYVHIPKDERDKLDPTSKKCVLVGYGSTTKGYRLYDLDKMKILYSRNVIFDETQSVSFKKELSSDESSSIPTYVEVPCMNEDSEESSDPEVDVRRSARHIKAPTRYGEWVNTCINEIDEPTTVVEALNGPEGEKWKIAMDSEMNSIRENNVWNLVESSEGCKPINCKWVFKKKLDLNGTVCSYKARLVAQGFSQKIGLDYEETFSPVVRFESVRSVLALAAKHNLYVHQMDVSSAFLNGELSEVLYMSQPEGFVQSGKENFVCKLNKAIYGLKQAPKCWNVSLDKYLKSLNFVQSSSDSCIYTRMSDGILCIIALYVDDIIVACQSLELLSEIKAALSNKYKMKDLGQIHYFLGVKVVQDNNKVFINQSAYTEMLLKRFNFDDCKPVATPVDVNCVLEKASEDSELFDKELYQSAVGSLLYLSTKTRPDITYAVCNVSKYCTNPTKAHWTAVKRIFRYLRGTSELGIAYVNNDSDSCVGYSDADWAGDKSDRKSTSGYCFLLSGGLISWRTNKQSCVALSTAEAEYVALSSASQEGIWLKTLLNDLKLVTDKGPMLIFEDNQSAICLAKNPRNHPKTKHISIKFHYIRELIESGEITVQYCPSSEMLADIFTKGLSSEKFNKLRLMLGVCSM